MIPIPIHSLTTDQVVKEILNVLLRIEGALNPADELVEIERQIRENTEALSTVTSNPPTVGTTMLRRWLLEGDAMSTGPFDSVTQALAAQTAAVAALTNELATEHQQWLDAIAAGDTAQAAAVVAEVQVNTDKLNALVAELEASTPGVTPPVEPPVEPEVPVVPEPEVPVEPEVVEPPVEPEPPLQSGRKR